MNDSLTPQQRLNAIVEQGLCIGCGLCQSVAGQDRVRVTRTTSGFEQPIVVGDLDHETVDQIYDVCPGTRIEGLPERLVEKDTHLDNVWGYWRRMVRGWATEDTVRHEGSTGGVMTALGIFLLESKRVDFILQVKTSSEHPSFGEPTLSFEKVDVVEAAGSRYGPSPPLLDIKSALDRNQPFAFFAKPCDVAALRNFARHDPRVDELVKYCIVMVCGGYGAPSTTEAFYRRAGIEPGEVSALRYRGRGCPGPTTVVANGVSKDFHYLDYWGDDESMWGLPFRCKICPDGIGEAADIAAADSWIGGSPNRIDSETDPGVNAIIARTRAGEELLEAAEREGALTLELELVPDEFSVYQPHQMAKKYHVWPRYQGLADAGRIVPETARLRIEALARENADSVNQYQREGTARRVDIGKATLPTPEIWKP
ncbi:MAG: Coenzyme F420 hydrogenase/dehydrogenase, beta subunit C-terminal domain [Pseudomonadota bacterium]